MRVKKVKLKFRKCCEQHCRKYYQKFDIPSYQKSVQLDNYLFHFSFIHSTLSARTANNKDIGLRHAKIVGKKLLRMEAEKECDSEDCTTTACHIHASHIYCSA